MNNKGSDNKWEKIVFVFNEDVVKLLNKSKKNLKKNTGFEGIMDVVYTDYNSFKFDLDKLISINQIDIDSTDIIKLCANRVVNKNSIEPDFIFTRSIDHDYRFTLCSNLVDRNQKDAIIMLQDYFKFANNYCYYSFPLENSWIVAYLKKTENKDHVGRYIYTIYGNIYDLSELGDNWFAFALNDDIYVPIYKRINKIKVDEISANLNIGSFINYYCPFAEKPLSWAHGVKKQDVDSTGLNFTVRFTSNINSKIEIHDKHNVPILQKILAFLGFRYYH